ncbi:hypothetical protein IV203_003047 [Nitzschia inconspicua]|uniref:S1 motif domain-containing protein n=1 Tax=Nitzschia inconspicua TaxID=303405 RepID=A0A9K3L1I3_9STRA|nr:hypothetical protein IV203_003047 [Nitzschia inconspicua]
MGGGEGAKERRRLKRIRETGGDTKTSGQPFSKPSNRNTKPFLKVSSPNRDNKFAKKSPFGNKAKGKPVSTDKKTKSKVKKPKHLKRKLEQAAEVDENEKEKLRLQLEEFERKKTLLSRAHNSNKRQKVVHDRPQDSSSTSIPEKVHPQTVLVDKSVEKVASNEEILNQNAAKATRNDPDDDSSTTTSESEDSDESSVEKHEPFDTNQNSPERNISALPPPTKKDGSSDSDSDSDDDEGNDEELTAKRQRGKRRRGRKDTSMKIEETKTGEERNATIDKGTDDAIAPSTSLRKEDFGLPTKRYCIGRKPVTDFVLGQCYPGKVVYVKPFGVFLDIGCHSDAFCHVSRLSDGFVESPETLFREGDEVPNVRVVEIDRRQKRITVSLQSEARVEDERASVEARQKRKEAREAKAGKKKGKVKEQRKTDSTSHAQTPLPQEKVEKVERQPANDPPKPPEQTKDPSMMTPAELKRARKLARRAARRGESDEGALAPQ